MSISMISNFVVLSILLLAVHSDLAAPEPAITAVAVIPRRVQTLDRRDDTNFRAALALRRLAGRASKPGMNVCYGTNSICSLFNDMDCPISASMDEWYRCMCETGYISAKSACQDCVSFYNLGGENDGDKWSKSCSSRSLSIAPIPAHMMSVWSEFNATVTGLGAGGGSGASKTGGSSASKTSGPSGARVTGGSSDDESTLDFTTSSSVSFESGARTFADYTTTRDGMPTGDIPAPLATTIGVPPLAIGGIPGGANTWNREMVWLFSIGAAVFTVLCGVVLVL